MYLKFDLNKTFMKNKLFHVHAVFPVGLDEHGVN